MNPACMQFEVDFKRVNSDESVMKMTRLGVKFRAVAVYILKVDDDAELESDLTTRVSKLSFKRAGKSNVKYKKQIEACGPQNSCLDSFNTQNPKPLSTFIPNPRLHSPPLNSIGHQDNLLLEGNQESTVEDSQESKSQASKVGVSEVYDGDGSEQFEDALSEGLDEQDVSESSDGVGDSDSEDKNYCVSAELEESEQESYTDSEGVGEHEQPEQLGDAVIALNLIRDNVSDYDESDEEEAQVVNEHTDWKKFTWRVGANFPNPNAFKNAVTQYALAQGMSLKIAVSDKKRRNRLGVVCVSGCPFRIYASWDRKLAEYTVNSVKNKHTCQRNMEGNSRLKSKWVAEQKIEVFKKRPHILFNEIIDMVKSNYSIMCSREFAYHAKYNAHKKLYGSMKDHYNKVMNYLCIDGCFIKIFLGGMLLLVIGRDPNEQMFLVAWAAVGGRTMNLGNGFYRS
ncbi:uncharacterized protein LOC130807447 [Amaranthus tricolor]|uniref:uncharacterized protein LOC130807447 n=1 Tax=Amaranthus tricolor TaxID=29722 RepID=UPI00258EEDDF|nr:uncharacterized protein LOC130807447 [Amaranthus tricolor]